MNRFRKHKKKTELEPAVSAPAPVASISKAPSKNTKGGPEPLPSLDLSHALPPTDNFRTSLLMPKLSARFSMLREQDDPLTKIGKASDDSVLFPKRASRLNLFGHNPSVLTDIDEVSSIDTRPSFGIGRTDSFASGEGDSAADDAAAYCGSIMDRPRRGEGNNLFGGRQKVYKIPVKTGTTSESARSGLSGRALYEDDLTLSTFQRMKLKAREEEEAAAAAAAEEALTLSPTHESEDAYSSNSSAKRTTFSSTASAPYNARTSTAATSIDELHFAPHQSTTTNTAHDGHSVASKPGPPGGPISGDKVPVKSRRLYGQGLTPAAQSQPSSAMHRLESLNRQRAGTPELPQLNRTFSKSATNLHDRLQRLAIAERAPSSAQRPASPPSSTTSPHHRLRLTDPRETRSQQRPPTTVVGDYGSALPLSPATSENEDVTALAAAVQPEDRGKATAMGLFNKPKTTFDENHFARRQLQMHQQGRNTSPLRRPSSPSHASSHPSSNRSRRMSAASDRSTGSASSHYSNDGPAVNRSTSSSADVSPVRNDPGTFFGSLSDTEPSDDDEDDHHRSGGYVSPPAVSHTQSSEVPAPPDTVNPPAESPDDDFGLLPKLSYSDPNSVRQKKIPEIAQPEQATPAALPEKPDSPTLGPSGLGLSGLVRTHLRQGSDRSSIYPLPSPGLSSQPFDFDELSASLADPPPPIPPLQENAPSRPRDPRRKSRNDPPPAPPPPGYPPPQPTMTAGARQSPVRTRLPSGAFPSAQHRNSRAAGIGPGTRPDEIRVRHRRGSSAETQKEREEFANELAERRRKVQEKLKSFAESDSRSSSPGAGPGRQTPDLAQSQSRSGGSGFSLLKNRPSKNSVSRPDLRNLRPLGPRTASSPALAHNGEEEHSGGEEERPPPFHLTKHGNSSAPHVGSERPPPLQSRMPGFSRNSTDVSSDSSHSRGQSPHSTLQSRRERSESDASGRSKSRPRYRERDDLETVTEAASGPNDLPDDSEYQEFRGRSPPTGGGAHRAPVDAADHQPNYEPTGSAPGPARFRSGSRPHHPHPGGPDRPLHPGQLASTPMIGASPRPSPVAAFSANTTPPLHDIPHDPMTMTASTLSAMREHTVPQRAPGSMGLQKRSINKLQISEPTLISSTSSVPLVGLPRSASVNANANAVGGADTPPLPPMNPRRRRPTATQTIIGALRGDHHRSDAHHVSPAPASTVGPIHEQSAFDNDDDDRSSSNNHDQQARPRNRLRKSSSEGVNLGARAARSDVGSAAPAPTVSTGPRKVPVQGGMF